MHAQGKCWRAVLACCLAASLVGCGTVKLVVPEGRTVRLLDRDDPTTIRSERHIWFWAWGGRPISDNTSRTDIEKYNLKEIRMSTDQGILDNIIAMTLGIVSFVRRTLVVEGNA